MNVQTGDRYLFSGLSTASAGRRVERHANGVGGQAGQQVIAERLQADQGTGTAAL